MKKISLLFLFFLLLLLPLPAFARENVTDWYIQSFNSEFRVNTDSSLHVVEKITADAGTCLSCHGIYRVLPTAMSLGKNKTVNTPVQLISITDFNNNPIQYSATKNRSDRTVSYKIGNPNKLVQGINNYRIEYIVKNAVRHNSADFDELYWNLNGNYWELEIDKYSADIIFPSSISKDNSQVDYYTGLSGSKSKDLATYTWTDDHTLHFDSTGTLLPSQGITASVTFPKNIIAPYVPSFLEKYGQFFWLLIPIFFLVISFLLWKKIGDDAPFNPTVAPEFAPPENYSPMQMGVLFSNGKLKQEYVSASIVNLAVQGALKIEEVPKANFFQGKDFKLVKLKEPKSLNQYEKSLLDYLFPNDKKETTISELKNKFYTHVNSLENSISNDFYRQGLIETLGVNFKYGFIFVGAVFFFFSFSLALISGYAVLSFILTALILLAFAPFMPRRPLKGALLNQKIKGFRLYINTAERYRQQFNEKENIFERYLPYAIMFGLTDKWINAMKSIYGTEYISSYHPIWYVGTFDSFSTDTLSTAMSNMSSAIGSNITSSPSSSGSGGGGFSGGGGGGGGGGGW